MTQLAVRELTPDLLPDWLAFFDHDAFAGNPDWASCYCHFFHADSAVKPWDDLSGPENRAAACALISAARRKVDERGATTDVVWRPALFAVSRRSRR